MRTSPLIVFSTHSYDHLRVDLAGRPGFEAGEIERRSFPDGELYRRIASPVEGRDAVVVGGTVNDEDTLEIYDIACALVTQGVHTLTLVLPYYGYQTMERAVREGEVVGAKTRARLLSSIPTAGSGNWIVMLDLHSEGIPHYFEGSVRPVHLYAKPLVLKQIRRVGGDSFLVGATDAGRAKWVESLANDLGVDAAFVFKRRLSGEETEVTALAADVAGKTVVIYDDMIRTGSSMIGAARAYLDAGATDIAVVTTHGVFPGDSLERLVSTGLFKEIVCTDSHPRSLQLAENPSLHVEPIGDLLAEFLGRHR
jgi:ribose-phosphate pyrophosphokinase